MDYDLESEIWTQARAVFGHKEFSYLLGEGMRNYRRLPGYSPPQRIHRSAIGDHAFTALWQALRSSLPPCDKPASFGTVRAGLRVHLYRYLQWQLIVQGNASEPVVEDQLVRDLSL